MEVDTSGPSFFDLRVVQRRAGPGGVEQFAAPVVSKAHDRPAFAGSIAHAAAQDFARHEAVVWQHVERRPRDSLSGGERGRVEEGAVSAEDLEPELAEVHDADASIGEQGQPRGPGQLTRSFALPRYRSHEFARGVGRDDMPGALVENEQRPVGVERKARHAPEGLPRRAVQDSHGEDGLDRGLDGEIGTVQAG